MDYVVGSVAALISGNVTPNRPKLVKRALTPMKHQQSPNVTPKSELVGDRSIFLSPTMQKKKAIVKKSPKRIFQNPDLDAVDDEGNSLLSPKADKVRKHLKDDLESNINIDHVLSPKSPKNKSPSPKKKLNVAENVEALPDVRGNNENTPKKKKKKRSLNSDSFIDNSETNIVDSKNTEDINIELDASQQTNTPKKKKKSKESTVETISTETQNTEVQEPNLEKGNKKVKIGKKSNKAANDSTKEHSVEDGSNLNSSVNKENEGLIKKKKNKKRNKNTTKNTNLESNNSTNNTSNVQSESKSHDSNESTYINPNAITNKDTDSEHESDDDIESENEETNKAVLDTGPEPSSDEDELPETTNTPKIKKVDENKERIDVEEEVKRTLFVGNVPFSSKCKKEIKNIFSKYGDIETVRIRTVPVKDARVTPKLAVIKEELHPDRSTVNVYIKYKHPSSVNEALVENNTVLNDHHLRVSRSDVTGSEHDPRCSVFVGNIPFALEDEGLRALFEKCGQIESVRIIRDRKTNAGKGFGYVNFNSKDGVELALALTEEDLTLKNRILRVKRCTQPTMNKQRRQQNDHKKQHNQTQHNQRQHNYQSRQHNNQRGFNDRGFQMNRNQFGNNRFQRRGQNEDGKGEGAYRRIMNKRKPQDGNEGPPNKRQKNLNQPREKKTRPEFVGMTAEKKKFQKRKLNKDQKKKKVFSEIMTKASQ